MHSLKKISGSLLFVFVFAVTSAQPIKFSIATDLGLQRSFKKEQQYWAGGHTIQAQFHFTPKDGAYFWISYYTNGKFSNNIMTTAKSAATLPQQINYVNNAVMRFKQISIGWRKYLKGAFNAEHGWNIYGYAGFGLLLGRIENTHSVSIDTTVYIVPVRVGKANFKRLTLDLGLGWEAPLGADIFIYAEGRAWIPTTDYPSKYIFVNDNAPLVGMFNVGIRILF
ncbi:MAG TPA: hypothetical protein VKB95_11500 [Chitinophagaceae bacterium]|nr:hypothetical protein [Chitinophagaceae bacterium]